MKIFASTLLFTFFLFLSNCSKIESEKNSGPCYGGTLNYSCLASLENLDPQKILFKTDTNIASLIYEGLIKYDEEKNTIIPCLAEKWHILDQGCRYIFKIRDNVFFHDDPCFKHGKGRQLTAFDVLFTFERIASAETQCPQFYLFSGKICGIEDFHRNASKNISGIRVLNDLEIEFTLEKPYVSFLKLLSSTTAFIVPKEATDFYGELFPQKPVGTGAFRFSQWKQLEKLSLVKNEHYWGRTADGARLPYLAQINIHLISNLMIMATEFLQGKLDLLSISKLNYEKLVKGNENGKKCHIAYVQHDPGIRFFGISFDSDNPLSRHLQLRRYLAKSFDRSKLSSDPLLHNDLANTLVPIWLLKNKKQNWYTFDPQFPKTNYYSKQINKKISISSNIDTQEINILQSALQNLGLKTEINVQKVDYYKHLYMQKPDIFRISYRPSYSDPEEYYELFHSAHLKNNNLTGYSNPEYDKLLELARIEQNPEKRQSLFLKLEQILKQDIPVIYLLESQPTYFVAHNGIHEVHASMNVLDFNQIWINREENK